MKDAAKPKKKTAPDKFDAHADGTEKCSVHASKRTLLAFGRCLVDTLTDKNGVAAAASAAACSPKVALKAVAAEVLKNAPNTSLRRRLGIGGRVLKGDYGRQPAKKVKQGCTKKMGRPLKVSHDHLKSVIGKFAKPSARFRQNGALIKLIPKSWRRLHMSKAEIKELISYRQLLRRTRLCNYDISKGKKRADRCPICVAWDYQVNPKVKAVLDDVFRCVIDDLPDYFQDFHNALKCSWWAQGPLFERESSPQFIDLLVEYMRNHKLEHLHERSVLAPEVSALLETKEHIAILKVEELQPVIVEWNGHFLVKRLFEVVLRNTLKPPFCGITGLWMDYQDYTYQEKRPTADDNQKI